MIRKSEIEMIRELERRGYRIYSRFKPFKAMVVSEWGSPYEVTVVGETPRYADVEYGGKRERVGKEQVYKLDSEVIKINNEAQGQAREVEKRAAEVESEIEVIHRRVRELENQATEIRNDARKEIKPKLVPVYPVKETGIGWRTGGQKLDREE